MSKDLKARFDEIIFTINLTPDEPTDDDYENGLLLPNLTRDLHEPELFTAILCQTFKSHEADEKSDFAPKMCALLLNSAMQSVVDKEEATDDDLHALALVVNITWALGQASAMMKSMGLLGALADKFEKEVPYIACAVLKGNKGADRFGKLDPYRILEGDYDPMDMLRETHPEMTSAEKDRLEDILRDLLGDE